jgi:hypothetical protein
VNAANVNDDLKSFLTERILRPNSIPCVFRALNHGAFGWQLGYQSHHGSIGTEASLPIVVSRRIQVVDASTLFGAREQGHVEVWEVYGQATYNLSALS